MRRNRGGVNEKGAHIKASNVIPAKERHPGENRGRNPA